MSTKIAVATEDGVHVSAHFGRAPYFEVLTIDGGKIVARERREKAHHQAGHDHAHGGHATHASMVAAARDCTVVIAGGMGKPAYASIQAANLTPILTDIREIESVALTYATGKLVNRIERAH